MANLDGIGGFDAGKVEPNTYTVLPAGNYDVIVVESKVVPTKDNSGSILELKFQVLSGEFQNKKLTARLNIRNKSPEAQTIARGNLSAICRAVGVLNLSDSSQLHNKPLSIKVVVKNSPEYGEQNEIKGFKARGAVSGPVPSPSANGSGGLPKKAW